MLFAWVFLEVLAHQRHSFEMFAVGPDLLGLFVLGVGDPLPFLIIKRLERSVPEKLRNITRDEQTQSDDADDKESGPKAHASAALWLGRAPSGSRRSPGLVRGLRRDGDACADRIRGGRGRNDV